MFLKALGTTLEFYKWELFLWDENDFLLGFKHLGTQGTSGLGNIFLSFNVKILCKSQMNWDYGLGFKYSVKPH